MEEKEKRPLIRRSELINRLADKGYTKRAATIIWRDVVEVLEEAFVEGCDVSFMGFGTFRVKDYKAKGSLHPATGEPIILPPRRTVTFKPGTVLKNELAVGFVRK